MGCNAWNHPSWCDCGWGGDTGGGGGKSRGSAPAWDRPGTYSSRPHTRVSFTNPNARCPVCGAAVFYFESRDGGRVFFDELGPPWDKHWCTDNLRRGRGSATSGLDPRGGRNSLLGWDPLHEAQWLPLRPPAPSTISLLYGKRTSDGSPVYLALPIGTRAYIHAPLLVRAHGKRADRIELSWPGSASSITAVLSNPMAYSDQAHAELAIEIGHAETLFQLAKRRHFMPRGSTEADLSLAANWYRTGAALGDWRCLNNLALLYEAGTGVAKDIHQAAHLLRLAAATGESLPRQNLERVEDLLAEMAFSDDHLREDTSSERQPGR